MSPCSGSPSLSLASSSSTKLGMMGGPALMAASADPAAAETGRF